jgi:hypothetical protein
VKLANLAMGKSYRFVAKRAGYKSFSGQFSSDGEPEVRVAFSLEKVAEAPPPQETRRPPVVEREPKREPAPTPRPPPASAVAKQGKFACSTTPAGAQIWVDGKNSGRVTPVPLSNALLLPVGNRKIVFKLNGKQTKPQVVAVTEDGVAKLVGVPIE